jgi:hypothetical protein
MGEAVERRRSRSSHSHRSESSRSDKRSDYRGKVRTTESRLKEAQTEFNVLAILRVGFGCLLAFSIAYLMLIWIFKADPLAVAPTISNAAPFVIPSSMQEVAEPEIEVVEKPKRELPSYLQDDEVKPFEPRTFPEDDARIAVPNIDPDEVFGQEFGL